jgi:hypothetical protein
MGFVLSANPFALWFLSQRETGEATNISEEFPYH